MEQVSTSSSSSSSSWRVAAAVSKAIGASLSLLLLLGQPSATVALRQIVDFTTSNTKDASNLRGVRFVSRVILPYGPDTFGENSPDGLPQSVDDHPWRGYGFGMVAADEVVYDFRQHYFYSFSAAGYIIVIDYLDPRNPRVRSDLSIDMREYTTRSDMQVCPDQGLLFVNDEASAKLYVFRLVNRMNPSPPHMIRTVDIAPMPGILLPNKDCSILAIAHAKNSQDNDGLVGGSVTFIRGFQKYKQSSAEDKKEEDADYPLDVKNIALDINDGWDDEYLLKKGLNMPLTKKALEYWDLHSPIADQVDFSDIRENYRPSFFLSPESIDWSGPDEDELLVNLQPNNGLMRINVTTNTISDVAGYGLKDHGMVAVDINPKDKTCDLRTYPNLFALKAPDSLSTLRYNNRLYLFIANEGTNTEFRAFNDIVPSCTLFNGTKFGLPGMEVPERLFTPGTPSAGTSALFNKACTGKDCVPDTMIMLGSAAVDYESDPTNPIFHRMVLSGGRGWSIYEIPEDPSSLLKLVYDSADTIERNGCDKFPWAHGAVQDADYAPADNMPNNTLYRTSDAETQELLRSRNDPKLEGCEDQGDGTPGACPMSVTVDRDSSSGMGGSAVEAVATGVACGRLITVAVTKTSSVALIYDITDISSPDVIEVLHLSPESQFKSAGVAYNDGTIGELVVRNVFFLESEESPSGKPSLMISGEHSGTISYWEFDCVEDGGMDFVMPQKVSSAIDKIGTGFVLSYMLLYGVLISSW